MTNTEFTRPAHTLKPGDQLVRGADYLEVFDVLPIAGDRVVVKFIDGGRIRQFTVAADAPINAA